MVVEVFLVVFRPGTPSGETFAARMMLKC